MSITVVGSLNYDVVTTVIRMPNAGETIAATGFATHNGGKGANQALACARLRSSPSSVSVQMVGCVGNDTFGKKLLDALSEAGVNVSTVRTDQDKGTGVATILVEEKTGQNRIMVYPGANSSVKKEDVLKAIYDSDSQSFTSSTIVFQNEIPVSVVQQAIGYIGSCRDKGQSTPFIVYNPSPIDDTFDTKLYQYIDCLIVNSGEARAIVPESVGKMLVDDDNAKQALDAAESIHKVLNLPRYLVITLGAEGCVYYDSHDTNNNKPTHLPAIKPSNPVIDTTGAGDTFLGALSSQLTEKKSISEAIKVSLAASSIAITRKGAGDSIPVYKELEL